MKTKPIELNVEKLNELQKEWMEVDSSNKKLCDIVCKKYDEIYKFFATGMISVSKDKTFGNIVVSGSQIFVRNKPINEIIQYAKDNKIISNIAWCSSGEFVNL